MTFGEKANEQKKLQIKNFNEVFYVHGLQELNEGIYDAFFGKDLFYSNKFQTNKQYYLNIGKSGVWSPTKNAKALLEFENYCKYLLQPATLSEAAIRGAGGKFVSSNPPPEVKEEPLTIAGKILIRADLVFDGMPSNWGSLKTEATTTSSSTFTTTSPVFTTTSSPTTPPQKSKSNSKLKFQSSQSKYIQINNELIRLKKRIEREANFGVKGDLYSKYRELERQLENQGKEVSIVNQYGNNPDNYTESLPGDTNSFFTNEINGKYKIFKRFIPDFIKKVMQVAQQVNMRDYGSGFNLGTILTGQLPTRVRSRRELLPATGEIPIQALKYIHEHHIKLLFLTNQIEKNKYPPLKYLTSEEYEKIQKGGLIPNILKGAGKELYGSLQGNSTVSK